MAYEQEYPLINGTSNDSASATPDVLGAGWVTASLASSADVDYFKLVTTSAALIELDLSNLLVTDSKLWSVALIDGSGDYLRSLTSTVSGSPVVDGSSNTGTTLKVTGLTADVPVGSRFSFVTSGTDSTLYTVSSATTLSGGGSTLTLTSALPSSLAASTALAFDPAQAFASGSLTSLTGQVSAAGTYYAKVSAASWTDADYTIQASVQKTVETADNGAKLDAIASSTSDLNRPVENAWMSGALSSATDIDVWVFTTATMKGSLTLDFAAATGSDTTPEWDIALTQWSGDQPLTTVQSVAISGTAGASKTFTIDVAKYTAATTFVVSVAKASAVTVDTGTYQLRLSGTTLDLNDTPLITIDSVTSSLPYAQIDTLVSRSVKAGADSKVALSTLFSVTDADAAQSIASYNVALSKATGETASLGASIKVLGTDGSTVLNSYALGTTATLTAAQMATAYLVPGSVLGNLSLALQAVDSSGASDGSGASSVMVQTLRVVSSAVGVTVVNDGTLSLEEGNSASTETLSLSLGAAPTADVLVYLEQDSYSRFGLSASVLTFTTANWATAQTVKLTARDNQTTEGAHTGALSFRVVSTDSQYDGYAISSLTVAIADPTNVLPTGVPTISGTPTEDQTLTASATGVTDPNGLGTPKYTWQRSTDSITWTDIDQATNATYAPGDADVAKKVRVVMRYTDDAGTQETVYSAASTIANLNDLPTGTVTITGTATQGQTLTAANTLADIDGLGTVSYQWSAGGTAITGASNAAYVLTQSEVGKTITVAASYTDGYGAAESKASSATTAVANTNDSPTGSVTISGTPTQGQTLTASNSLADLDGMGTVSYQWSAGGTVIAGASTSTFVLTASQLGKAMTVAASYTDGNGAAESKTSSATAAVAVLPTGSTVEIQAYSWKAHTLLDGVAVGIGSTSQSTGSLGSTSFAAITDTAITLSATRSVPSTEAATTSAAVNLQDAIAILKMIVGLEVNGTGKALSPYQALAADYDGNGQVQLSDAIGVLKHVVGLTAPDPTWYFVNEIDSTVPAKANLAPGVPQTSIAATLGGTSPVHVGLVGYLSGDVDGSFAGTSGSSNLPGIYFIDLITANGLQASQFGVYP